MGNIKPLVLEFTNIEDLEKQKAEYDYIGREVSVDRASLTLTVLTLPSKYKKKSEREAKIRARREADNYDDYS